MAVEELVRRFPTNQFLVEIDPGRKVPEAKDCASDAVLADLAAGLRTLFAYGSVRDAFVVWEGGDDAAICKDLPRATRVAKALRLAGSVERVWVTKGPEFENVYDEPMPLTHSPTASS